jgi:cytochrome c oxidase assembly factor CtaG
VLSSPVNAFGAYVVVTYGLYATPLLEKSLRAVPAHLFASAAAVGVGLMLVSALLSAGRTAERSHRTVVVGLAVYLVLFAVVLASRDALYAPAWFGDLDFAWAEPLEDQRRGAGVVLAAVALLTPLLLLATRTGQVVEGRRPRTSPDR